MRAIPRTALLALLAAVAAAPGSGFVVADAPASVWSAASTIPGSKTVFPYPYSAAVGADGTIAVVFRPNGDTRRRSRVRVAVRRRGHGWSRTRTVSDVRFGAGQPRIAVSARGEVLVA